jgi:hypothetical protein
MTALEEILREVTRHVTEAEMRTTARTASLMVLLKTGYDTVDLEHLLWDDMEALDGLRRHQWMIRDALIETDPAASAEQLLNLFDANMRLLLAAHQCLQDLKGRG